MSRPKNSREGHHFHVKVTAKEEGPNIIQLTFLLSVSGFDCCCWGGWGGFRGGSGVGGTGVVKVIFFKRNLFHGETSLQLSELNM